MTIPGNPKEFARDIADGFFVFNAASCRQFEPAELRTLHRLLEIVAREIRAEAAPLENVPAVQRRNQRLGRANNALAFIRTYAKRRRIPV